MGPLSVSTRQWWTWEAHGLRERPKCRGAHARCVVLEDSDEVRHEAVELGLVGDVAAQVEQEVERADDGRGAEAVSKIGTDEREEDQRGTIYRGWNLSLVPV